ncbi:hypothetical protein [Yinghuangia seranimata]|uniref:hypothetical protein n=1 Tax=Yinghuangia seranimata TaxID=408067 RepID=UPI00248B3C47|nr:hypothetical protein [Yinghuangia seranimata]MDI2130353.1 hypothetical protein [Yinghuangia seranimata]
MRTGPLTGVAAVGLSVASFLMTMGTPDIDKSAQQIRSYYVVHENRQWGAIWLLMLAGVALVFFSAYLFSVLRARNGGSGWLPHTVLVGGVATGVGYFVAAASSAALVDAANERRFTSDSIVALNAVSNDAFFIAFFGMAVLMLAAGLAVVRAATPLPRWMGWAGVVIGVGGLVPWVTWIAFPLGGIWILVASVLLWFRDTTDTRAETWASDHSGDQASTAI